MARQYLTFSLLFLSTAHAFISEKTAEAIDANDLEIDEEERLLVIPAITLNVSSLGTVLPIALALATSLASILATVALAAVVFSLFGKYKYDGYGGGYGGSNGAYTSYSSSPSYRSLFDPSSIDWEKFSILDLLSVGEEIWHTFDPSDINCQKRLICELHQNTATLGFAAERIVDLFGYLTYAKVTTLPDELDELVDEFLDAADKGIMKKQDCGDMFPNCKFSLTKIASKYLANGV